MVGSYSLMLVAASYCVAVIASYTAIYFGTRVFELEGNKRQWWLLAGALCLGSGIWSMHFVGMSAYDMPMGMEMTFSAGLTALSWLPAMLASGLALYLITLPEVFGRGIAGGALVMGAGIFCMHYLGMHAMQMQPAIQYDPVWVSVSGAIAVLASGAALLICRKIREVPREWSVWVKAFAALVMGAAICGMHYSGMAAAIYPMGAEAAADNALRGDWMGVPTAIAASVLLLLAIFVAYSDVRDLERARRQQAVAQDEAHKAAFYDRMTGLGNRSLLEARILETLTVTDAGATPPPFGLAYFEVGDCRDLTQAGRHDEAQEKLQWFARQLQSSFPKAELIVRYSSASFMVLGHDLDEVSLAKRIARLRSALKVDGGIDTWGWGASYHPESASNTRGLILVAQRDLEWERSDSARGSLSVA